jgi:DNA-binding MarR family transcriptional regulator
MGTVPTERRDQQRVGEAWRELRRGASMIRFRELLYGDELEMGQVDALDLLVQNGTSRMRELADALRVDASTATRTVNRLVDAGLVERVADPDDARGVRVRISRRGADVHATMAERRRRMFDDVLGGFDPDELAQFAELLERLVAAVDEAVGTSPHRH